MMACLAGCPHLRQFGVELLAGFRATRVTEPERSPLCGRLLNHPDRPLLQLGRVSLLRLVLDDDMGSILRTNCGVPPIRWTDYRLE